MKSIFILLSLFFIFQVSNAQVRPDPKNKVVIFPENNFDLLISRFSHKNKDVTEIKKWITDIIKRKNDYDDDLSYITQGCLNYINDVREYSEGIDGAIDKKTMRKKWGNRYDLKYANFLHLFSTGQDAWASIQITDLEYLGELNNSDWFKVTIKGGWGKNDYSNTLVRVVKVISRGQKFYLDNFLSLSAE